MKYLLLLIFALVFCMNSCKKEKTESKQNNFIVLSGEVQNSSSKIITVYKANEKLLEVSIDSLDKFRDTLVLPEGYYALKHNRDIMNVYLKPSFDLYINVDAKDYYSTFKFSGIGAIENNFMLQNNERLKKFKSKNKMYDNALSEAEFLTLSDSLTKINTNYLVMQKGLDNDFVAAEKNAILLEEYSNLYNFKQRRFWSKKEVSTAYPNPLKKIDFENEAFLKHPSFIYALNGYFSKKSREAKKENDSISSIVYALHLMDIELKNQAVKNAILYDHSQLKLGGRGSKASELIEYCKEYLKISTNKKHNSEIKLAHDNFLETAKGKPAPNFQFEDINGKLVSLKDLKGKPIFIDIWATWCGPCIQQFPGIKILEEKYKDIQFLGICMDSKKDKWKKVLNKSNPSGIQLFAKESTVDFFQKFKITDIPRYIAIGPNGEIIEPYGEFVFKTPRSKTVNPTVTSLIESML